MTLHTGVHIVCHNKSGLTGLKHGNLALLFSAFFLCLRKKHIAFGLFGLMVKERVLRFTFRVNLAYTNKQYFDVEISFLYGI